MFIVYILHSQSLDRYYVGYTNDLERGLTEHNRKKGNIQIQESRGSWFTTKYIQLKLKQ